MFHVPRYDPNAVAQAKPSGRKDKDTSSSRSSSNGKNNNGDGDGDGDDDHGNERGRRKRPRPDIARRQRPIHITHHQNQQGNVPVPHKKDGKEFRPKCVQRDDSTSAFDNNSNPRRRRSHKESMDANHPLHAISQKKGRRDRHDKQESASSLFVIAEEVHETGPTQVLGQATTYSTEAFDDLDLPRDDVMLLSEDNDNISDNDNDNDIDRELESDEGNEEDGKQQHASDGLMDFVAPRQRVGRTVAGAGGSDDNQDENPIDGSLRPHARSYKSMTSHHRQAVGQASNEEIQRALRVSQLPIEQVAQTWHLAPFLIDHLVRRDGFQHFFPIQALVLPDVIASERYSHVQSQDVCITAPTGSGKSLAYVLPILNALATGHQQDQSPPSQCHRRRLRALVVLPSRDLAMQVHRVFENYMDGSDLVVGLAVGQTDFVAEQVALTVDSRSTNVDMIRNRLQYDPGNLSLALAACRPVIEGSTHDASVGFDHRPHIPRDGWSNVDVLVCTPGRLVDHLDQTPGFTLQHLRFLVVDEADRLLSQSYDNWIDRVIQSTNAASVQAWRHLVPQSSNHQAAPSSSSLSSSSENSWFATADPYSMRIEPITWRRGGVVGDGTLETATMNTNNTYFCPAAAVCQPVQLRKFLVSATLTRDPQKLAQLRLINPKHFDVHAMKMMSTRGEQETNESSTNVVCTASTSQSSRYSMPEGLSEFMIECTAEQKPIVLLALVLDLLQGPTEDKLAATSQPPSPAARIVVVFTSSVDSTHRLSRLLQLLWGAARCGDPASVVEFSSALSQHERSALIDRCNQNHFSTTSNPKSNGDEGDTSYTRPPISVVICSDGMSRGLDLHCVYAVINYDVPRLAKTYVHRCGRTARAHRRGMAITLLKKKGDATASNGSGGGGGQVVNFQQMRSLIQAPDAVQWIKIKKHLVDRGVAAYRDCLQALKQVLDAEENGELAHTAVLSTDYYNDDDDDDVVYATSGVDDGILSGGREDMQVDENP